MPYQEDINFVNGLTSKAGRLSIADIGCGPTKYPGSIGIDVVPQPGVDVVHNLDQTPWPMDDNRFDLVLCNHLIEHVDDFVATVKELHRILKPGGYLIIRTPHYSHVDSFVDPTHKRHLTTESFNYFVESGDKANWYTPEKFTKDRVALSFGSGLFSQTGKLLSRLSMRKYEKYWCRLFPASTLYFRLRKIEPA